MSSAKSAAVTVLAIALAAALAFLYYKTDIGEFRKQLQIATYLRELKDVDTRWEMEILRLRGEVGTMSPVTAHLADSLRRALAGLEADSSASRLIAYSLLELKRALLDKADLMEKYRAVAANVKQRLETTIGAVPEINKSLRQAMLAQPGRRDRIAAIEQTVGMVQTEVLRFNLAPDAAQIGRLEAALAALRYAEPPGGPEIAALLDKFSASVGDFYKTKFQEHELHNRLIYLTAGPRLDTLMSAFHRELDATTQEKELFRTALITYAGVLLILSAVVIQPVLRARAAR